jgi:hypothetical protein
MKIAKVQRIHKKEGRQEISNYRQISILQVFSKMLEILIYKKSSDLPKQTQHDI